MSKRIVILALGAVTAFGMLGGVAGAQTACEEQGRDNGTATGPVHTADEIGETTPAAPVTEPVLHDTVEPLTCEVGPEIIPAG